MNALFMFYLTITCDMQKYWKLVYKGSDIDYIEIVSDSKDLAVTANTNRNYDYFVIMCTGFGMSF